MVTQGDVIGARANGAQLLVGDPAGRARIWTRRTGAWSPEFHAQSVLARGYWRDPVPGRDVAPPAPRGASAWDPNLHPRDERGRFGEKGGVSSYAEAVHEPITPMVEGRGSGAEAVRAAEDERYGATLGAPWRTLAFTTAGGERIEGIGREAGDPDGDHKLAVCHDLAERMLDAGVTRDQLEAFADGAIGGWSRAAHDATVDAAPLVDTDTGTVGLSQTGTDRGFGNSALAQPAADDPAYDQLLAEGVARTLVSQWASSANDSDPLSLAVQDSVARVFSTADTAAWNVESRTGETRDLITEHHGPVLDAFVRAQYDSTQEMLAAGGIDELQLYRGVKFGDWDSTYSLAAGMTLEQKCADHAEENGEGVGKMYGEAAQLRPASSFALDTEDAAAFQYGPDGGALLVANVPAERVLGTPSSGFGCLNEDEAVVLGGGDTKFDIEYAVGGGAGARLTQTAITAELEGQPNGEQILANYELHVDDDPGGMPGEYLSYLEHPITHEQIPIDSLDDVEHVAAALDPDPEQTAKAGLDGLADSGILPPGWSVELQHEDYSDTPVGHVYPTFPLTEPYARPVMGWLSEDLRTPNQVSTWGHVATVTADGIAHELYRQLQWPSAPSLAGGTGGHSSQLWGGDGGDLVLAVGVDSRMTNDGTARVLGFPDGRAGEPVVLAQIPTDDQYYDPEAFHRWMTEAAPKAAREWLDAEGAWPTGSEPPGYYPPGSEGP